MLSQDEIRGDWNNVKGTEYHLVYALWLLLCARASEVAFYEGNDLRAQPISPPALDGHTEAAGAIPLRTQREQKDVWIQLKSTAEPWTTSDFLDGNLLQNFVCNALTSQRNGRPWEVRLVTQAIVRRTEVLAFAADPGQHQKHGKRLERIVESVVEQYTKAFGGPPPGGDAAVRALALGILKALSGTEPVPLGALKAEIERELAYARPNRTAVARTASQLIGAMLRDAAAGPGRARTYDVNWLTEVAGPGVRPDKPFDRDEGAACDMAIAGALPTTWHTDYCSPRTRLQPLLNQFLSGGESLFVLLGKGGTGKTWAVASWTARDLARRIRLYVPASTLAVAQTLDGIVAVALAPLTGAHLNDTEYLERFRAAALGQGVAPPLIVVDDLQVSLAAADNVRSQLARLTRRAREAGVKLVVTCQTEIWEAYQLWRDIPAAEIFSPDPTASGQKRRSSIVLDDFSPDERAEAVSRRLPAPRADQAALQLRGEGLTALRNPYLLGLYIEQHGQSLGVLATGPDPVVVDDLLWHRLQRQLERAAGLVGVSPDAVEAGFTALVAMVWTARPASLVHADAVRTLAAHLPEQGKDLLEALQRVGLVTNQGGVRIAEEPIANYLFAAHLLQRADGGEDIASLLAAERDSEVVAALIRGSPDPVQFADRLVRKDGRWARAASVGLSQCSPADLRVVAMLTGFSRPTLGDVGVNFEECRSLGQLAARGHHAWDQVLSMYLSDQPTDRQVGEVALGAALEVVPERVGEAIRARLAVEDERGAAKDADKRLWRMTNAFAPLHQIAHRAAANVARGLLPDACSLASGPTTKQTPRLLDTIDDIRGRIALFGDDPDVAALCGELADANSETRYRAAAALRPVAFENPDRVRAVILDRLRVEAEPHVLLRVLWMATRVVERSPDEFLAAFRAGSAAGWSDYRATAPALAMLGLAARHRPAEVLRLLPRRLDACEPWARAMVSELLAYAWWCVAETEDAARAHLEILAEPDVDDVPGMFRTFAFRGAAIARLAQLCLGRVSVSEMSVEMVHFRGAGLAEYLFIDAGEFCRHHARLLTREGTYPRAEEAFLKCVQEHHGIKSDIRDKDLQNARYFCAGNSLEVLYGGWAVAADPLPGLNALPRDWEALRAARQLLDAGRRDAGIIAFARQACDDSARQHSIQAGDERQLCLIQLARLGEAPQAEVVKQRESMAYSFFAVGGRARGLTALVDEHPCDILSLLDGAVSTQDEIPVLYDWGREARSWQGVLIAGVYARMFSASRLEPAEARLLAQQMLAALRALPASPQRDAQATLYATLASWLDGDMQTPASLAASATPIGASHALASELLATAANEDHPQDAEARLRTFLSDRRGWWETTAWTLKEGSLCRGSGIYLIYVFPAVRLALAAVAQRYGLIDPVGKFMEERRAAFDAMHEHHLVLVGLQTNPEWVQRALADLEAHAVAMPHDERLSGVCGNLSVRLGRLEAAGTHLNHSLQLPSCTGHDRASVLYDLACVEARLGRGNACREALVESRRLRPLDAKHMAQDADLDSVRTMPWFQDLINNPTIPSPTGSSPEEQPPA